MGAVAALLGAAIGAGGAVGSAAVTGRHQARTQHDQWRRQARRDAYATFMNATAECFSSADVVADLLRRSPSDIEGTRRAIDTARASIATLQKAGTVILLEGPEHVAKAGAETVRELHVWLDALERASRTAGSESADMAIRRAALRSLGKFQVEAQQALQLLA